MLLNILYLKYFFDSVRSGSISAAARLNHVSQSAVSQGIAKLEISLHSSLISHQPNRFCLTEEGRRLYESSKGIFQAIQKAEDELSGNKCVTLNFACYHSFALSLLPEYIKKLQNELPHLRCNFRLGNFLAIKEMIKKRVVDFGISTDNDNLSGFDCYPIMEGEYRLFASQKVKKIETLPFLLDNDERTESNVLKSLYKARFGRDLPVFMEVMSWSVVARLAEEGLGIALAPDYIAKSSSRLKPVLPELNPGRYKIYAVFEKNRTPSTHEQAFIKAVASY